MTLVARRPQIHIALMSGHAEVFQLVALCQASRSAHGGLSLITLILKPGLFNHRNRVLIFVGFDVTRIKTCIKILDTTCLALFN